MQLSPVGVIANILWYEIENRAKNVTLGEFVVMPNHIHGILMLNDNVETLHARSPQNDDVRSLHATTPPQDDKNEYMSSISPKPH